MKVFINYNKIILLWYLHFLFVLLDLYIHICFTYLIYIVHKIINIKNVKFNMYVKIIYNIK